MSFILDALRKSENARQRHGGPALAEVPIYRRRESRPWWIGAVVALLLVNLVVLVVVLTRDNEPATPVAATPAPVPEPTAPPPAPAATPAAAPAPVAAQPAAAPPPAVTRSLADEAAGAVDLAHDPAAPATSSAAANVPEGPPLVRSVPPAESNPFTSQTEGNENLPNINELTGDRAANMPAMHIDIHVHSAKSAERFVFINMKKYIEGDTLSEGPLLERITTDGVILNQGGFRFILPRQ
jgi:general secretion pathway protein B